MTDLLNAILVVVLVLNLLVLGTSRILAVIRSVALQGALLGLIPLLVHEQLSARVLLVSAAAIALKGVAIPAIMTRALRDAQIKREVEPLIGLLPSMILGALATAFAMLLAAQLPLVERHAEGLLVPTSVATVLVGFILLTTRWKALSQVVGYLVLENGIFIMGLTLQEAMPFLVEVGVLLDLLVAIFVIGIVMNHINREFASLDVARLDALKE